MIRTLIGSMFLALVSLQAQAVTSAYVVTCSGQGSYGPTSFIVSLGMNQITNNWTEGTAYFLQGNGKVNVNGIPSDAVVTVSADKLLGPAVTVSTSPLTDEIEYTIYANIASMTAEFEREGVADILQNVNCTSDIQMLSEGYGTR